MMTQDCSFLEDLYSGLSAQKKSIPTKYLYGEFGSQLYNDITEQPEYYPTRTEQWILEHKLNTLQSTLSQTSKQTLLELGSGYSQKTLSLLKFFSEQCENLIYQPSDISQKSLDETVKAIAKDFPNIKTMPLKMDYLNLESWKSLVDNPDWIIFLGSTMGNFSHAQQEALLKKCANICHAKTHVLLGFDLKKSPSMLNAAYNDAAGVTKKFILNILLRANRELGTNFDLKNFDHYAFYHAGKGSVENHIISLKTQEIEIPGKGQVKLDAFESIFIEDSYKYSLKQIEDLADKTGFKVMTHLCDDQNYFVDSVWAPK